MQLYICFVLLFWYNRNEQLFPVLLVLARKDTQKQSIRFTGKNCTHPPLFFFALPRETAGNLYTKLTNESMGITMTSTTADFHSRSIEKVKKLWHLYILGENPSQLELEFGSLPEHLLMIGTGRHEFYQTKEAFLSGMSEDQLEARDIQFELHDEWYEVQGISDTVCIVYGSIWAREKVLPGQTLFVDMQGSRFTMVCKDTEHGVQICSIHHSMPYIDQGSDEYYPKTLASLAKELEQKAELDRMTGLYSRYYMEQHVSQVTSQSDGYFLVLDLDDFKNINDTMGHLIGDQAIGAFADILKEVSSPNALLGRMGGDEFAVWDAEIRSKEEAEEKFSKLLASCEKITAKLGVHITCSAGIFFYRRSSEKFSDLYQRADQALYQAKALGKAQLFWADQN